MTVATITGTQADESQSRALLHAWAEVTRTGRPDDVLARHAPDV